MNTQELTRLNRIRENVITRKEIWDITEEDPIPSSVEVSIEDFDACGCEFVEYRGRIYMADPDELNLP